MDRVLRRAMDALWMYLQRRALLSMIEFVLTEPVREAMIAKF